MKKCPFCSAELYDDAQFCLYCMRSLTDKKVINSKVKKNNCFRVILVVVCLVLCHLVSVFLVFDKLKPVLDDSSSSNDSSYNSTTPDFSDTDQTNGVNAPDKNGNSNLSEEENSNTSSNDDKNDNNQGGSDSGSSDDTTTKEPDTEVDTNPTVQPDWLVKTVSGGVEITGIGKSANDGVYNIPAKIDGKTVVGIGEKAFYNQQGLKSITLPNTVKYIDVQAFYGCTSLTTVKIPSNVMSIGKNAFVNCKKLSKVYILSTVVNIDVNAFSTQYQRDVDLTIYASASVMNSTKARIQWDADYIEYNG